MSDENTLSVEATDNSSSDADLQEQISAALDEPEATDDATDTATETDKQDDVADEPPVKDKKDNTIECPEKFLNEDGSADWSKVLKSYKELEPLVNEKAAWEKERAELLKSKQELDKIYQQQEENAKNAGYSSSLDMQQQYEIAALEANEYAKYLSYTDDPAQVRQMLVNYMNNPTPEQMADIEMEFAPEINKRVAIASERKRIEYETQQKKDAETSTISKIESVISQSVDENSEIFNYEPFKKLFLNAIGKYKDNFTFDDAKALIGMMTEMKGLYEAEFEKQHGIKVENDKDTDKLAAISGTNSAPAARQLSNADIDKMSTSELAKEIRKYL